MKLKVGERLSCEACDTEVIVVRAPDDDVEITCDGHPLLSGADSRPANGGSDADAGTQLGKRYADGPSGLELLCTRSGAGALQLAGRPLEVKQAKNLPSSD